MPVAARTAGPAAGAGFLRGSECAASPLAAVWQEASPGVPVVARSARGAPKAARVLPGGDGGGGVLPASATNWDLQVAAVT